MSLPGFVCRCCDQLVTESFVDLGATPLANDYLLEAQLADPEIVYPLHVGVCTGCSLVQLDAFETPERIFSDYAYFSSFATSWVDHAKRFAHSITEKLKLHKASLVVEVASNDGYLLRHFRDMGIPILGVEPAENIAIRAQSEGIPTDVSFFGVETAERLVANGFRADLLVGNNVLAHVPKLNDFVAGLAILLKPGGRITLEFPHLARLIESVQFDTIYHEHFSYFSLLTIEILFQKHGLMLVDVDSLETHGGSLRVHMAHEPAIVEPDAAARIQAVRTIEAEMKLGDIDGYRRFQARVLQVKHQTLDFLIQAKKSGKTVVGYGAAAKGNTMLNYCGVKQDLLDYVVDISPHKQGRYLPGSRIPVLAPKVIAETKPDYVWILPWNLKDEIVTKMAAIREWNGRFVTAIPELEIF